jgi:hypothetical protein
MTAGGSKAAGPKATTGRPAAADLPPTQTESGRVHPDYPLAAGADRPHRRAGPAAPATSPSVLWRTRPELTAAPICHRSGARGRGACAGIPSGGENRSGGSARDDPAVPRPLPPGDAGCAHLRDVSPDVPAVRGRDADHRLHHRSGGRSGHPGARRRTRHSAPYRPARGPPEWYEDAAEHAITAGAQPAPEQEYDQRVSW